MLNETFIGIAQKLNQVFGDGYEIYIDEVEQGLKEPCFLISCVTGNQEQIIGPLYNREQQFDIHYFPQGKRRITSEVKTVIAILNMELEYITVDGNQVRGTKMNHETIEGVLHFFVNYDVRIRKVIAPDPAMETVIINGKVKTDGD